MGGYGDSSHDEVLQVERAVNETYRREAEKARERWKKTQAKVAASTNASLHKKATGGNRDATDVLPFIGRVGLGRPDPDLGASFYVGHEYCELPGGDDPTTVVSWAAPVAQAFYTGPSEAAHPKVGPVAVTRSFQTSSRDLVDFDDDTSSPDVSPHAVFAASAPEELAVPTAPRPVNRPKRKGRSTRTDPSPSPSDREPTPADSPPIDEVTPPPQASVSPASVSEDSGATRNELRAGRLVSAAIQAPRTGQLGSILSTLQGNQYELVTWPASTPLVIQGPPGTGKTIVATHRAAYLMDRWHEQARKNGEGDPFLPLDNVALIGPTTVWASHVRSAIDELRADRVEVIPLDKMIQDLAGALIEGRGARTGERADTTAELARFLELATKRILDRQRTRRDATVKAITRALLGERDSLCRELGASEEVRAWLKRAESWKRMRREGRYIQALAVIGSTLGRGYPPRRFQHIVVDEAQDLSPMEWWLVNRLHAFGGTMTLVGDLQQRRTDWSPMSWSEVDELIELSNGIDELDVQELEIAFRSTNQILRFASQLLPKGTTLPRALQSGPEVEVVAVSGDAADATARLIERELQERPKGLLAVITVAPDSTVQALRRTDSGWRSRGNGKLQRDGRDVWMLSPDRARGLEFDSVIVLEPADFPQNLGRSGPLYTSLTRATHALAVVHTKPLPNDLRPPKRHRSPQGQ